MTTFGIIKERKHPTTHRVVFTPQGLKEAVEQFPKALFIVECSDVRTFKDEAYHELGFQVQNDMSSCDVLIGVKEVPIEALIPDKKYFFFSHTIKKQAYNRDLLRAILEKNIEFYDHETIVDKSGRRLIGFGRYAGIVGAYSGLRTWGLKHNLYSLPSLSSLDYQKDLEKNLKGVPFGNVKIILTGKGRVGNGVKEILDRIPIRQVSVDDFLNKNFKEPIYVQLDALDYNKRKDGKSASKKDFYQNPQDYRGDFMKFATVGNLFIAGHFYEEGSPKLFTKEMARSADFSISVVADISCDIAGPIACTIRPSTIENPIYGYDIETGEETNFKNQNTIAVMAVDNLPCALPKDASQGFGSMFLNDVIPAFFNDDQDGILERARVTKNGKLTQRFNYLQSFVDGNE